MPSPDSHFAFQIKQMVSHQHNMHNFNHIFHRMHLPLCPSYLQSPPKCSLLTYNHLHKQQPQPKLLSHLCVLRGGGTKPALSAICFAVSCLFPETVTVHERQKTYRKKSSQCVDEKVSRGCRKDFHLQQDPSRAVWTPVEFTNQSSPSDSVSSPTFEYSSFL